MRQTFRIGTRGSGLALWQANHIQSLLNEKFPDITTEIKIIKTTGDLDLASPLSEIGGKGVFVKEIEEALLSDAIDIAVHSMKDMPSILPDGLCLGAVVERHDPRDILVSKDNRGLSSLAPGARIGTGSLRRGAQLLHHYPGLKIVSIRGNVDTRIKKVGTEGLDGVVLAKAGVERMGLGEHISEIIPVDKIVPAPGQGIVALERRESDVETDRLIGAINHQDSWVAAVAERAFLRHLAGDCNVPVGCHALPNGNSVDMVGLIASPDGREMIKHQKQGLSDNAEQIGKDLAASILDAGGADILASLSE